MYHFPESSPEEPPIVELRFGEEIKRFTPEDTFVRRFTAGGGTFDHCVHVTNEGQVVAFTPTPEALARFEELGFAIRIDAEPDEATINHFVKVQMAQLDKDLP